MNLNRFPYYFRKGKIRTFKRLSTPNLSHISALSEKVSKIPQLKDFKVYVGGSLAQGREDAKDLDIFFTGDWKPESICWVGDRLLEIGLVELGVFTDVFYITSTAPLRINPLLQTDLTFKVYTTYNFEIELNQGSVIKFRDYDFDSVDGLFCSTMKQQHEKAIERGYTQPRIIKV